MSSSVGPTRETTLALIFGASRWPYAAKFEEAPSFERSADALFKYLEEPSGLGLPVRNIKTFFNSRDDAAEQLEQAASFIERHRKETVGADQSPRDLLVLYVGHGDFEGEARDFYLSIRRTNEQRPLITSITARELGNLIRRSAGDLRSYLIIDCCFAAALQHGFMTSPVGLAELKLHEALPPASLGSNLIEDLPASGVALLAAAGLNRPAVAPVGHTFTAFTAALLDVFKCGHVRLGPRLSLQDIHLLVERRVSELFPDAARPEMRPLQQSRGRVELVAFFPNPAFEEVQRQGRREAAELARQADGKRGAGEPVHHAEERRKGEEAARNATEASRLAQEQPRSEETRIAEEQRGAGEPRLTEEKPQAEKADRQKTLTARTEEEIGKLKSERSSAEVMIKSVNKAGKVVQVVWLDFLLKEPRKIMMLAGFVLVAGAGIGGWSIFSNLERQTSEEPSVTVTSGSAKSTAGEALLQSVKPVGGPAEAAKFFHDLPPYGKFIRDVRPYKEFVQDIRPYKEFVRDLSPLR